MSEIKLIIKENITKWLVQVEKSITTLLPEVDKAYKKFTDLGGVDIKIPVDSSELEEARQDALALKKQLDSLQSNLKPGAQITPSARELRKLVDENNAWSQSTTEIMDKYERVNKSLRTSNHRLNDLIAQKKRLEEGPRPQTEKERQRWGRQYLDLEKKIGSEQRRNDRIRVKNEELFKKKTLARYREVKRLRKDILSDDKKQVEEQIGQRLAGRVTEGEDGAPALRETYAERGQRLAQTAMTEEAVQQHEKEAEALGEVDRANKTLARSRKDSLKQVKLQRQAILELMDTYPTRSKQYRMLEKDLKSVNLMQSLMTSKEEKDMKKGDRLWQRRGRQIIDNTKRVRNMSRHVGFMNSRFAQFSIIMSGMAATLFVWQEFSRVIQVIVGTVTKMERAMAKFRLETSMSADEMAALEKEAHAVGRTGYQAPERYLQDVTELSRQGISGEGVREALQAAVDREQKAGRGTLDDSIKSLIGEFRYLTHTVMKPLADDIKSAATSLASLAARFAQPDHPIHTRSVTGTMFEGGQLAQQGWILDMRAFLEKDFNERQKIIDDIRKRIAAGDKPPVRFQPRDPSETNKAIVDKLDELMGENRGLNQSAQTAQQRTVEATQSYVEVINDAEMAHESYRASVINNSRQLDNLSEQFSRAFRGFEHAVPGLDRIVSEASRTYKVSEDLIWAVMKRESNMDPLAVSKAGAEGLMQLMPEFHKARGVTNAFDPRENVMAGTKFLSQLQKEFKDLNTVLAAYNRGPTFVRNEGMGAIPKETTDFITAVNRNMDVLKTRMAAAAQETAKFNQYTGEIRWEELRGDYEQTKKWLEQTKKDVEKFYQLFGVPLAGQFTEADQSAQATLDNVRRQMKKTGGFDDIQIEEFVSSLQQRLEFERQQLLLAPAMKDYKEAYSKLGKTSSAYWDNEHNKLGQHIKELGERLKLTKEQIAIIQKLGEERINAQRRKPYMETLQTVQDITGTMPDALKQSKIKDAEKEYRKISRTMADFGDYVDSWVKTSDVIENQKLADYALQLTKMNIELESSAAQAAILERSLQSTGNVTKDLIDINQLKAQKEAIAALAAGVDPEVASELYQKAIDDQRRLYIEPSLSAFESMYQETGIMTQEHYEKRLELIELERQAYIRLTEDEVAARRWAEKRKHELMADSIAGREYDSVGESVYRGMQAGSHRLMADQKTLAERVSNTWVQGAENIAQAWDEAFFTFMNFEFENLKDVGIGMLQALRDVTTEILNDILKQYAATFIRTGLAGIFGGVPGGINGSSMHPGGTTAMASGGILNEPVVGTGLRTGTTYTLAENGPELVIPKSKVGGGELGGISVSVPIQITAPVAKNTANRMRDEVESTVLRILREEMR